MLFRSPNDSRIGTTGAPEKLASWGMTDGITDLRDGLKEYYNHDRFEVLKKRANKSLSETRDYLESILGQFTPGKLDSLDLGHRDIQELGHCLGDFKQEAAKKRDEIVAKIWEETPFSKRLDDQIEEIFPEQDAPCRGSPGTRCRCPRLSFEMCLAGIEK